MNLSIARCRRRSHLVEELVEAWQLEHESAMLARDVDEVIAECAEMGSLLRHAWDVTANSLFDGEIEDVDGVRTAVIGIIDRTTRAFRSVRKTADNLKALGYDIERDVELVGLMSTVDELRRAIDRDLPEANSHRIADSVAAFRRGDFQPIEDMLRDAQGHHSQAD
jgi:hypothetical protein